MLLFFVLIGSLSLLGCNTSEFKVDGDFTAFLPTVSSNKPQVTMVTVTIEDGEIVAYDIDVRQGKRTQNAETLAYSFSWNTQTKNELGYGYHMHYSAYTATLADINTATEQGYQDWLEANDKLEWFEQAAIIEAYWLANGVDSIVPVEGEFPAEIGVSISDSNYVVLAAEAVELAKLGKFQAIACSGSDLYMASMIVSPRGEVSELVLDTLQATKDTVAGTFVWKDSTKQELGDDYGMKGTGAKNSLVSGAWVASTTDKTTLEWYEQANLITAYVLENGWDADLKPVVDRGVSLDGTTLIDACAGVTIKTTTYFAVLASLFGAVAEGEIK
jgi:major membrane immunogen (membrane-anchored lipoprotein)